MTGYVVQPPRQASLPVRGADDRFPVRRIWCVGRNYAAHAREMGHDDRDPPFFFQKPADAAVEAAGTIPFPPGTADLHHEVELVVCIGTGGADIAEADVASHLWGAAVGIDLTRRDVQAEAKAKGRPWDLGKGFDRSAPIGVAVPMAEVGALDRGRIWLAVNGETRQEADLSEMIWSVAEHVSILSRSVALAPGDLVMTGTPAGVGPLVPGDRVAAGVEGLPEIALAIGPPG